MWVIKRSSSASDDVCECVSYVLCCSSGSHHVCLWVCLRLRLPACNQLSPPCPMHAMRDWSKLTNCHINLQPYQGTDPTWQQCGGQVLMSSCLFSVIHVISCRLALGKRVVDCVVTERKPNAMTENGKFLISVGSLDESVFQWFSATPVRCSRPTASRSGLQQGAR